MSDDFIPHCHYCLSFLKLIIIYFDVWWLLSEMLYRHRHALYEPCCHDDQCVMMVYVYSPDIQMIRDADKHNSNNSNNKTLGNFLDANFICLDSQLCHEICFACRTKAIHSYRSNLWLLQVPYRVAIHLLSDWRQKGSTTSVLHSQLNPFAS